MRQWVVTDSAGREIYLTEERWQHIISGHGELRTHLEDVLNTIQRGKRQQQRKNPQAYVYRLACSTLRPPYNGIMVSVVFRFATSEKAGMIANNFVITAWGIVMR